MSRAGDATATSRLDIERAFHDRRYAEGDARTAQHKYYYAVADGAERMSALVAELARGADVLEYGCGAGSRAAELSATARTFHAIDISEAAIRQVAETVAAPNVYLHVMDAMSLAFEDRSFDLVFGSGIVHHLDTAVSAREVSRVLRPGGSAVFWEPLGYNPLINAYRWLTPGARTPDEHPLLARDLSEMRRHFASLDVELYGLCSIAAVPFRNAPVGPPLRDVLTRIDRAILAVPGVRLLAWYALIRATR